MSRMNFQGGKQRPPPLRGNVPLKNMKIPGPTIKPEVDELLPTRVNINKQLMSIGSSISKLSDHTDRLGIKLKDFSSPSTGPPSLVRGKHTGRKKLSATSSTDLLTKFDNAVKKTDPRVARKTSQVSRQSGSAKFQPKANLMHSFLMGDKETVSEEMTKLHKMVASDVDTTLGYGYSEIGQRRETNSLGASRKNSNAITIVNPDSERTFKAINTKIDNKVAEWMRNSPRLNKSANTINKSRPNSELLIETSSNEIAGKPVVHNKLKQISDEFHKSLSNATRGVRDLIKTPDDDYVHELSEKTQNALAKISITEKDIDDVILSAIKRQQKPKKKNLTSRQFMPLHNDPETHKKLQNYVERRKEPFAPRPPRKNFDKDYVNSTVMFEGFDEILPSEMKRRTSLIEASEPQIFQRKVDSGQLDNHRRIVDPTYPHNLLSQRKSATMRQDLSAAGADGWSVQAQDSNKKMDDLKATYYNEGPQSGRISDPKNKYRPNSPRNIPRNMLDMKLGDSMKTIGDAAKVANALGSLMSRISLSDEPSESMTALNVSMLQNLPKSLQKSETQERRKNDVVDLATELRKMADDSERSYHKEMKAVRQKFSTLDKMKLKKGVPKYQYKNDLPLLPDVSYTDQILLKKLKSMQDDTK